MKNLNIPPLKLTQLDVPYLVEDKTFVSKFLEAFNDKIGEEKKKNENVNGDKLDPATMKIEENCKPSRQSGTRRKRTRRNGTCRSTHRNSNRNTNRSSVTGRTWYKEVINEHNKDVTVATNNNEDNNNNPTIVTITNNNKKSNGSSSKTDNLFTLPMKANANNNYSSNTNSRFRKSKSTNAMLLSPRTVENILTMANDDARNGNRASLRDLRDAKRGVTPKINDIATDKALIFKPDRHVQALQRHSLQGATTDCYAVPITSSSQRSNYTKSKDIFPKGNMIHTKTAAKAQNDWVYNLNKKKYDLKKLASKPGRSRAPPYATKWLNKMVPIEMELRELPILTPQTQHFCANVDMPLNPFLQFEHQAYLRAERQKLKKEKMEWEEYEYQTRKQEIEEYKYRIYLEPKIEREAERRRQEEELKKLQAMQRKADDGFKFKKKKKRKGKIQQSQQQGGSLAATV